MIRNSDLDIEPIRDRSQRPIGLAKRLIEPQAKRQPRLDRRIGIDRLTAAPASRGSIPCRHGFLRHPERESPPPDQGGIKFRPVRPPVFRIGNLVTAALVDLRRHWRPDKAN
jgi:hypothetical protein